MSRTSAKRPVRNPFVVTLAAAAAILTPACGARVDSVTSDAGGDTNNSNNSVECPRSTPMSGAPCSGDLSCNYNTTNCGPYAGTVARCENGEWQVMTATCNPPPPECPREEPTLGTPCGYSRGPGCSYPDRCAPGKFTIFTCNSGNWQMSHTPPDVACPTTPPSEGASCADCAGRYPSTCVYEYCGSYPSRESVCNPVTKTWSTRWSSCNPPPPSDGGPGWEDAGGAPDDPAEFP